MYKGIDDAVALAAKAHEGQKDYDGNPVILHPLTVGLAGETENEQIVGFLHDVVEDTSYTFDDLLHEGFSPEVVDALRLLTHDIRVPYEDYVRNICQSGNLTALHVKRNDLKHNIFRGTRSGITRLVEKHSKALEMVEAALEDF